MRLDLRSLLQHPMTLGLLLLSGCTTNPVGRAPHAPAAGAGPVPHHAVHSKDLRAVMSRISALDVARLPQELGPTGPREPDLAEIARVAGSLAESASRIPQVIGDLDLDPAEREVFLSLARRLQHQSQALRGQAVQGRTSTSRATLQEINTTCAACHALFRS
jgi:hypothetical protein